MLRLILQATEATKPMGLSSGTSLDKSSTTQLGPEHVGLAQAAIRLRMAAQPGPRHSGLSQPAQPKPNTAHLGNKRAAGTQPAQEVPLMAPHGFGYAGRAQIDGSGLGHAGIAQAANPGPRHADIAQATRLPNVQTDVPGLGHAGVAQAAHLGPGHAGSSQATGPSVPAALKVCIHYTIPASYAWQPWLNITAGCSVFR